MPSSFIISGKISTAGMKNTPCRAAARNVARDGPADGLLHHVGDDEPALQGEGQALEPQSRGAAGDDLRVVPEQSNQLGGENIAQSADHHQEQEGILHAEPEAVLHPLIELGSVVEAADRLETLAEADHGRAAELGDALDHAHGRR